VLDQRGQLLRAAVGFAGCSMLSYDRALWALRSWLDSWPGIGHVAVGMHCQGFDLQLTQYDDRGWRATFYTTGMEHSPTSATGTGWERTPWRATQRAAWEEQASRQLLRRVRAVFVFALFLGACALANTPQQDLAYARWAKCNSTSATLDRVDLGGQITFRYTAPGDREEIVQCFTEAGRTGQPLPEPVGFRPVGGQ
jgi:hypothetical protein